MKKRQNIQLSLTMFDLLKGMAMLAVILQHSISWDVHERFEWKLLYSVLMPVFFVTSGYWMKAKPFKEGVKSAAKQILKPYLFTLLAIEGIGLVHRILTGDIRNWLDVFFFPGILGMSGAGSRLGPLWFLLALFWAWTLFYLTAAIKRERAQICAALLAGVAGGIWIAFRPPFQLAQGLIGFFFLYGGYLLKKKKILPRKLNPLQILLMAFFWLFSAFAGTMDMGMYDVRYGFFSMAGSFCGAFLVIRAFLRLDFLENPPADAIRMIGRYTMWILCIHGLEGAVVPWDSLLFFVRKDTWAGCVCWLAMRLLFIGAGCAALEKWNRFHRRQGGGRK